MATDVDRLTAEANEAFVRGLRDRGIGGPAGIDATVGLDRAYLLLAQLDSERAAREAADDRVRALMSTIELHCPNVKAAYEYADTFSSFREPAEAMSVAMAEDATAKRIAEWTKEVQGFDSQLALGIERGDWRPR